MKKILLVIVVIGAILVPALQAQPAGYARRILLNVDPVNVSGSTDLVDFPLLVNFSHNDLRSTSYGGDMQNPSGYDILFTANDGLTPLNFELEQYAATTGQVTAWVRIPSLSATATTSLYLYFSNPSVYTDPGTGNVWTNNYMAVYHFQNSVLDETPNGNDLADLNTSTNISGKIGQAREFTGDGDQLEDTDAETVYLNGLDSLTMSMWVKADVTGTDMGIMFGRNPDAPGWDNKLGIRHDAAGNGGTNIIRVSIRVDDNGATNIMRRNSLDNLQTTNWQHIAVTWENGILPNIYINGSLSHGGYSTDTFTGVCAKNKTLLIGRSSKDGPTSSWDGLIDEFRMDSSMKSADWIATEYANQNDPVTFLPLSTVNEAPVLNNLESIPVTFLFGGNAVNVTSSLEIFDYNNMNMSSASVWISAGYSNLLDTLTYSAVGGIVGTWTDGTGTLSFSGSASKADYETIIKSIQFNSTDATVSTRTVGFSVYDGTGSSSMVARDIQVNVPNDPPSLTGIESAELAYTDGEGQTAVTSTLVINETDDAYLESATIQITGNYQDGEDRLFFTNANGIIGSWSTGTGTMSLSGTAGIADYQAALRSILYENISHDPVELTRTVSFVVNDGSDLSNSVTRDITVTKANDAPVIDNIETEALAYSAGDPAIALTNTLTLIDYDDTQIDSAKVRVTGGYIANDDTLVYPGGYGITNIWQDGTGTLFLNGTASVEDYQSALRTITYQNTNTTTPSSVTRVVTFYANDGLLESDGKTRSISSNIPGTISNLELWLRADAGVFTNSAGTSPTAPDGKARYWFDQSGNGRNFDANLPRPLLRTNVASLNNGSAIEMTGADANRYRDADGELYVNGLTELTAFYVVQSNLTNSDQGFWAARYINGKDRIFSLRYAATGSLGGGTNVIKVGLINADDINKMESSSDKQTTDPQIICLDWKSGQVYDLYLDGVLDSPTYRGSLPVGPISLSTILFLGRGVADETGSWNGYLAEVILYSRHLSETERFKVEDYISTKYDIPVRLIGTAKGGEAISADDANTTYTALSGPRLREDYIGELSAGGTIILEAPSGFEWNSGSTPTATANPAFGTGTTLAVSYTSITTGQITFTVNTASSGPGNPGEVTFGNIEVRPTTGILPNSGNITNSGTTGPTSATSLGTLTMVAGAKAKLLFQQQPTTGTVDEVIAPAVVISLHDQFDNAVEKDNVSILIALTTGTGVLGGTLTKSTDLNGQVTFDDLTIDELGTKQLTGSSTGLNSVVSNSFNINAPNTLTTFLIERPSGGDLLDQIAGQSFGIKITARDGGGVLVSSFTGTAEITSTGTLSQGSGTTANFVAGELSGHNITITNTGDFTITATNSAGPETGNSNVFTVAPGSADPDSSKIDALPTIIVNNGISTSTITVTLKDSLGNFFTSGGDAVNLIASAGMLLSTVTDNNDGTYVQTLQSSLIEETATITGVVNGQNMANSTEVLFSQVNITWESDPGNDAYTTDWNDTRNWSTGTIPTGSDVVLIPAIPADGTKQPVVSANSTVGGIVVELNADVTLQNNAALTVSGKVIGDGDINGNAGTSISVTGNLNIATMSVPDVVLNGTALQSLNSPTQFTNLEINSTNEIRSSENITVSGTLTLTNGILTIPSGKSLIANTKSVTNGQLKFQRDIIGTTGWRLLAAPVISSYGDFLDSIFTQGYTGSDSATGSPSVLWYDETFSGTDNQRWRKPANSTDTTVPGRGLFVYVFGDIAGNVIYSNPLPLTLDVTGTEEEGTAGEFDFGVTYTTDGDTGWNLIGNPFGATIDWDGASWTKTNIEQTIYVWDNTANSGNGDYLLWNGVTGSLGSGLLPPFQGFWIKANAINPTLKINKAGKTSGGVFYKIMDEVTPQIMFLLEADTLESNTCVMFHPQSSLKHDTFDGYKLKPLSDTFVDFGSVRFDNKIMTINSLPDRFGKALEIPIIVGGQAKEQPLTGEFRISWPKLGDIPEAWTCELVDQVTGAVINLKTEIQYYFNNGATGNKIIKAVVPGDGSTLTPQIQSSLRRTDQERFILRIDPGDSFPEIPRVYSVEPNYPNPFNSSTTIQFNLPLESTVSIKIYDLLGREISEFESHKYAAGSHKVKWKASTASSGIYLVRVQINETNYIQKMTVIK